MAPPSTSSTVMDLELAVDNEVSSQSDVEYEEENSQPRSGLVGAMTAQCKSFGRLC